MQTETPTLTYANPVALMLVRKPLYLYMTFYDLYASRCAPIPVCKNGYPIYLHARSGAPTCSYKLKCPFTCIDARLPLYLYASPDAVVSVSMLGHPIPLYKPLCS